MPTLTAERWYAVPQTDARVVALYRRHYSCDNPQRDYTRYGISGPGEPVTLLSADGQALWVWRPRFFGDKAKQNGYDDGERGVMCAVFRNEGRELSSELVREADELAFDRWPGHRHFTYVNPFEIGSVNPGYCFKRAGWLFVRRSKAGLHVLAKEAASADPTP